MDPNKARFVVDLGEVRLDLTRFGSMSLLDIRVQVDSPSVLM